MHDIVKHTFKNINKFLQSFTNKPLCDELLVFGNKTLHVCIPSRKPRACQKPALNLPMPNSGIDNAGKCPAVARGGGGGEWAQLQLTDA